MPPHAYAQQTSAKKEHRCRFWHLWNGTESKVVNKLAAVGKTRDVHTTYEVSR
jgi:hypothetical protein